MLEHNEDICCLQDDDDELNYIKSKMFKYLQTQKQLKDKEIAEKLLKDKEIAER